MPKRSWLEESLRWNSDYFTVKSEPCEGKSMALYNRGGLLAGTKWKHCLFIPLTKRKTEKKWCDTAQRCCACSVAKKGVAQNALALIPRSSHFLV